MARYGLSYGAVEQMAQALEEEGLAATVLRIRERLGTGSASTIARHLRQWRGQQAGGPFFAAAGDMPPEVHRVAESAWLELSALADAKVEQAREEERARTQKLHRDTEAAIEASDRAALASVQQANARLEASAQRAAEVQATLQAAQALAERRDAELQAQKERAARLEAQLAAQQEAQETLLAQRDARAAELDAARAELSVAHAERRTREQAREDERALAHQQAEALQQQLAQVREDRRRAEQEATAHARGLAQQLALLQQHEAALEARGEEMLRRLTGSEARATQAVATAEAAQRNVLALQRALDAEQQTCRALSAQVTAKKEQAQQVQDAQASATAAAIDELRHFVARSLEGSVRKS